MFADIVFPQKVGPLTYSLPAECPEDPVGRLVEAPLRKGSRVGLVISVSAAPPAEASGLGDRHIAIREVSAVHGVVFDRTRLALLRWLSSYYMTPQGMALSSMFFDEAVLAARPPATRKRRRPPRATAAGTTAVSLPEAPKDLGADLQISLVTQAAGESRYHAFLLHAPSRPYEHRFLVELLHRCAPLHSGILVLVPEIGRIDLLAPALRSAWGDRVCVLHSRLTKARRAEAVREILAGRADIVIGTRSAVLAPMSSTSLIIVTEEHHPAYKAEEGLRYHGRDVAVMRAFTEGSTVLLSSVSPSLETYHNVMKGKYIFISDTNYCALSGPPASVPSSDASRRPHAHRPRVRVVDIRGRDPRSGTMTAQLLADIRRIIAGRERVLLMADRKGYSLLRCGDCGHLFRCPRCEAAFVFSRDRSALRCGRCTFEQAVPASCAACGGYAIEAFGTGTERLRESLAGLFEVEPVIIEKRPVRMRVREMTPRGTDQAAFIVGTAYAGKRIPDMTLGAAVLMNVDALLSRPDFRAYEHAFQEIMDVMQLVRSTGALYLVTRMPANPVLRHLRRHGSLDFLREELLERAKLSYPPLSRMVLLTINAEGDLEGIAGVVRKAMHETTDDALDTIGPAVVSLPRREDRRVLQIVLRCRDRNTLHKAAGRLMKRVLAIRGVSVTVDVDPLKV